MKQEFKIFLTALMFYTRIPVKQINGWSEEMLNKSTRYFPLIGLLIGVLAATAFWGSNLIFPASLAVVLSMAATMLLTGAFHEDGFADFCDGFGGGAPKEKILEIMKDSRIGTYGTIGLVMILGTKFMTLIHLEESRIPFLLITGHAFSRVLPVLLIYTSEYVRLDQQSKVKPVGKKDSTGSLLFALATGMTSLVFIDVQEMLTVVGVSIVLFVLFRMYVKRRLGGYAGDVLGALQQLGELFFYLAILSCQNFL